MPVVYSATSEALTSSFTTLASTLTGALGEIAPIAITVMGAYLTWRYGIKFFKSLAK